MKNIIIFIVIISCFIFLTSPALAATYTLYGSVTDTTSQINVLIGILQNQTDFKIGYQYLAARIGEYDYRLFYGEDLTDDFLYIDYSRYNTSQYNYEWRLSYGSGSNLNIVSNNYTYVSNTPGGIYKSIEQNIYYKWAVYIIPLIAILLIFYLFRPSKGVRL